MTSDYTQDVEFNSAFGALQTPVHMFTAAMVCGVGAPPLDRPFRFLDLACGNGLTVALLADAYPHAEFVGIDINPAHIRRAGARAVAAGLTNVTFLEGDILSLRPETHEPFDYCALGGLYAWLDPQRQAAARAFVGAVLRPGGLAYVDYSTMPGMAQTAPLYHMLQRLSAGLKGDSAERLSLSAGVLDRMRQAGAAFFSAQPVATKRLQSLIANAAADEAHEVLNFQGQALWSCDVIAAFADDGLDYVGNCGLHHNMAELSPRPELFEYWSDQPPALQQLLFDTAWNVSQRKDLYRRRGGEQPARLSDAIGALSFYAAPGALSAARLNQLAARIPRAGLSAWGVAAVAEALEHSATFADLLNGAHARGVGEAEAETLITRLLALRLVSIAVAPPAPPVAPDAARMPSALNRALLDEDLAKENARPLASPVAGSRVLLPLTDRIFLA
ncbi:MAG: class I SAM-dependent methyltransferase, partial [Caulobacterales bacterium]|nr:class I SAM-dependent methyltransferase [Caulobacterales bacterium]